MDKCPKSPKKIVAMALRYSLGLSLLFIGIIHYMDLANFTGMVTVGLGALEPLGVVWAYVLPALQIVAGALLVLGMMKEVAAWAGGIALGSIPAGLLLKPILSGGEISPIEVMPLVADTFIWLFVLYFVIKSMCCCGSNCTPEKK